MPALERRMGAVRDVDAATAKQWPDAILRLETGGGVEAFHRAGGVEASKRAGLPVEVDRTVSRISNMRQVRVVVVAGAPVRGPPRERLNCW